MGRIRKTFMKEVVFDMRGISGDIIGMNFTGRHFSTGTGEVYSSFRV